MLAQACNFNIFFKAAGRPQGPPSSIRGTVKQGGQALVSLPCGMPSRAFLRRQMPGAVQSQDLAIVGFGTVGSYFLVTGTALLSMSWHCVVASLCPYACVALTSLPGISVLFRVAPYNTEHAERLHTAGIIVASAVPFKAGLPHVTCGQEDRSCFLRHVYDQRSRDRKLREESRIRASLKPGGRMGGLEIVFRSFRAGLASSCLRRDLQKQSRCCFHEA